MKYRKWILVRDIYDTEPYECPYCGARVEMQHTLCPHCGQAVIVIPFEADEARGAEYERIIEQFAKLP